MPALLLVICTAQAEFLGAGSCHGYFAVTRWGQKVLHLGPFHLFVSDSAAEELEKHRGKHLEVDASRLSQPTNPGAACMEGVAKVTEIGVATELVLSAELKTEMPIQGEGLPLTLTLRNDSDKAITMWPGDLAIVFVTDSPFSNVEIGYKDPNNSAYWSSSGVYASHEPGTKPIQIACHQTGLPWTAKDLVNWGQGIRVADKDRGFNGPITIEPRGHFQAEYLAGKELLSDDYEVFFYIRTGNLSSIAGPMSKRLAFDVIEPDQE